MKRKRIVLTAVVVTAAAALSVGIYTLAAPTWDVPQRLHCEGTLTDATGTPVTGDKTVTFRIWDDATSKEASHKLWDETLTVSFGAGGSFRTVLGATSGDELPSGLFAGGSRWLGMEVGSTADAAGELAPRLLVLPVPYSLKAGESARIAAGADLDDGKIGGGRVGDLVSALQGQVSTLSGTVTALQTQLATLQSQMGPILDGSCPIGYTRDTGVTAFTLCKRGADEMVKVGDFWIDRFESIVVDAAYWNGGQCNGTGTIYGDTDDWSTVEGTLPFTGNWPASSTLLYSCSKTGVPPSRYLTWFQAQQALSSSGKHLCTNGEWQAAAAGTPDPGASGGGSGLCVTDGAYRNTGLGSACASKWGAQDMVGNLWEWVDLWGQSGADVTSFANGMYQDAWDGFAIPDGDDGTLNLNGMAYGCNSSGAGCGYRSGLPFAAIRGGSWDNAAQAGVFALHLSYAPSGRHDDIGFRGCRRRKDGHYPAPESAPSREARSVRERSYGSERLQGGLPPCVPPPPSGAPPS